MITLIGLSFHCLEMCGTAESDKPLILLTLAEVYSETFIFVVKKKTLEDCFW